MAVAFVGKGLGVVATIVPTGTVTPAVFLQPVGDPPGAPTNVEITVEEGA